MALSVERYPGHGYARPNPGVNDRAPKRPLWRPLWPSWAPAAVALSGQSKTRRASDQPLPTQCSHSLTLSGSNSSKSSASRSLTRYPQPSQCEHPVVCRPPSHRMKCLAIHCAGNSLPVTRPLAKGLGGFPLGIGPRVMARLGGPPAALVSKILTQNILKFLVKQRGSCLDTSRARRPGLTGFFLTARRRVTTTDRAPRETPAPRAGDVAVTAHSPTVAAALSRNSDPSRM